MPFAASFSVPSGAASQPTSVSFRGPSGVEIVVVKVAPPANHRFDVYILGGSQPVAANMDGTILRGSYTASEIYHLQYQGTALGALDAAQVAALADATLAGPALAFPVGMPYIKTSFAGNRANPGTGVDAAVGDPVLVDIQGVMQRY